jgi:hypothetical protein
MFNKTMSLAYLLVISTLFYGMTSMQAHAYLDPGTGSMILQVILGGFAGIALAGKLYWHRFRTMIGLAPAESGAGDDAGRDASDVRSDR